MALLSTSLLLPGTDVSAAPPPPPGNLVVNGSFEDCPQCNGTIFPAVVAGWTETTGCGFEVWSNGFIRTADTGVRLVELDAFCNSAVQQVVPTAAGQTYQLSYAFSARPRTVLPSNAMNVYVNGVLIASHTAIPSDYTTWRQFTATVTATGATTLKFAGAGTSDGLGSLLDSVRLVECKPGNGFGDKNHVHCGPPGQQ